MSDVFVNIYRGCDAVIRNIFVVIRARLAVHRVYTWDRHSLITPSNVPENKMFKIFLIFNVKFHQAHQRTVMEMYCNTCWGASLLKSSVHCWPLFASCLPVEHSTPYSSGCNTPWVCLPLCSSGSHLPPGTGTTCRKCRVMFENATRLKLDWSEYKPTIIVFANSITMGISTCIHIHKMMAC